MPPLLQLANLLFRLKKKPEPAPQARMNAANVGRGFGYGNTDSTKPLSPPMPKPTPRSLDLNSPRHYTAPKIGLKDVAREIPGAVRKVGQAAGVAGDALLGGPQHLANVASYPAQEAIWRQMRNRGQISNEVYLSLTNEAGNKAGFGAGDKSSTVFRKTAGAVAGPTAAILTAGVAPALKGLKLGKQVAKGAKFGAGVGATFGGIGTLQQDKITPGSAALNIGAGAAGGAALGAAGPLVARGAQNLSRKLGQGGYVQIPYQRSKQLERHWKPE